MTKMMTLFACGYEIVARKRRGGSTTLTRQFKGEAYGDAR